MRRVARGPVDVPSPTIEQRRPRRGCARRCGRRSAASSTRPASSSTPISDARRSPTAAIERVARGRRAATRNSSTTSTRAPAAGATSTPKRCSARLTGAEAAVVVNNNAAATLLRAGGARAGREVIVSRGELVEIGGGFRVPDVMAQSGAIAARGRDDEQDAGRRLRGRDQRTDRADPARPPVQFLASKGSPNGPRSRSSSRSAEEFNIPVAEDLGSGWLGVARARSARWRRCATSRSSPTASPRAWTSCCFSGDKLLGGPQAGIIVGRAALVDASAGIR